ncbi:MAG: phosphotransferase [Mariprofundaceae bacterium]
MTERFKLAKTWVEQTLAKRCQVDLLAGDASFRRYFRVKDGNQQYVLMDAPPDKEDVTPFLNVRAWFETESLRVPSLIAADTEQGFLLLEDFGDMTWSNYIAQADARLDSLFDDALRQLHVLQSAACPLDLPIFDVARMKVECALYLDWYLPYIAAYTPSADERKGFLDGLESFLDALASLPQVAVHLDYHSRNLMLPKEGLPLGVIDFQDAVIGPVTYDLASLLYDCYQNYAENERYHWSQNFYQALPKSIATVFDDFEAWHQMLRLTALQRHIKAIGIFSRLAHRDGKRQFLSEISLTRKHLQEEIALFELPKGVKMLLLKSPI